MPIVYRDVKGTLLTSAEVDGNFKFLDDKVNLKSDKTYVDQGLNLKADKSYVDTGLLAKADKTYVDGLVAGLGQSIATKSDKTYVDSQVTRIDTALAGKASLSGAAFTGTVTGITKAMVGLPAVDNTSDLAKPISTLTATALAGKAALNGDVTKNFNLSSINNGPVGGIRNKILNPAFRVNQRGVVTASVDASYVADCWRVNNTGLDGRVTYGLNQASSISVNGAHDMYIQNGNTTKPVLASTDYTSVGSYIEGYDASEMMFGTPNAKDLTLTFMAFASVPTVITAVFRNADASRSYVAVVSLANQAQMYTVSVPGDKLGTWGKLSGLGISVRFFFACGTTFHTPTPNAWISGNAFGHASMSNLLDTVNRFVQIADVQLDVGSATKFACLSQADELARCQRYAEAGDSPTSYMNAAISVTAAYGEVSFKTTKRAPPSISMTSWAYYSSGVDTPFVPGLSSISVSRFVFTASGLVSWYGWAPGGRWVASSDL